MVASLELIDRFRALQVLESTTYASTNCTSFSRLSNANRLLWNEVCCCMYQFVDTHQIDRELVYIALNYMGRHLARNPIIEHSSRNLHLIGMTSLFLANKIYRRDGKGFAVTNFVDFSKELFTEEEILRREECILNSLQWRVHPPTPHSYLDLLIILLHRRACSRSTRRALFGRINFLLELSTTLEFFGKRKPSSIAVAAFIEVMEHEQEPNIPKQFFRTHFQLLVRSIAGINCDSKEVVECRDAMKVVHKFALRHIQERETTRKERIKSPVASDTYCL